MKTAPDLVLSKNSLRPAQALAAANLITLAGIRQLSIQSLAICYAAASLILGSSNLEAKANTDSKDSRAKAIRLISTAPSNTELIYSLNAGKELVGVSESCNFPTDAKRKEIISSFNSLKMEKVAQLKPDCIFLVSGQESLAYNLKKHGYNSILLDNSSIENISKNLLSIGKVIKQEKDAEKLGQAFDTAISKLKKLTASDKQKPRVFICVWPQPLMSAGKNSFMNEGVTIAGGINCTGDLPQPYPRVNQEKLILLKPDLVIVPAEQSKEKFWDKAPWTTMKAVKENRVYVVPQHETDCLTRPTLRYIDALSWLAVRLHPTLKSEIDKWHLEAAQSLNVLKNDLSRR